MRNEGRHTAEIGSDPKNFPFPPLTLVLQSVSSQKSLISYAARKSPFEEPFILVL